MRRIALPVALFASSWGLVAQAHAAALTPAVQARLGIHSETVAEAQRPAQTPAFAKVMDPGPLLQLESDLAAGRAAAKASDAEHRRLLALGDSGAARKDVEAVAAQAQQDALRVRLLSRRVGAEWGPSLVRLDAGQTQRLLDGLAAGRLALVHLDTPSNEGQADARSADIDVGSEEAHAVILGPARVAEPRLQSSGLIGLVEGPLAIRLSNGLTQSARLNLAKPIRGVLIPRAALIRRGGADWVYLQTGPTTFERRMIELARLEKDGAFVASGVNPGERVVVGGVGALLTLETSGATGAR